MAVLKKKIPQTIRSKRSRGEQSGYLKRFHGTAPAMSEPVAAAPPRELSQTPDVKIPEREAEGTPRAESTQEAGTEPQEGVATCSVISQSSNACIVEQRLVHRYGPGRPYVTLDLRLSTAVRGQRNLDGCIEVGYLFRLEVLHASPAIQVEGFSLGPWRAERVSMDEGTIFVADPLWAAFQPQTGRIRGRMLLLDAKRKCVLDLPWNTEALVPGPKPHVIR